MPRRTRRSIQQAAELAELEATLQASTPAPGPAPALAPVQTTTSAPVTAHDMERLIESLTNAVTRRDNRKTFHTPHYQGESDVDIFIAQFEDVVQANQWTDSEATLHLRLSLNGKAASCGQQTDNREEIYDNLRSRFGITTKQAKDQLRTIRRNPGQSLHELSCEISKLTNLAYGNLSSADRTEMALDTFSRALEHVGVQRHLLQAKPTTLSEMVRTCEEFFQIGKETKMKLTAISETEEEVAPPNYFKEMMQQQQQLLSVMIQQQQEATNQQALLMKQLVEQATKKPRAPLACYHCKGNHMQRNCPLLQKTKPTPAENAEGPAQ